MYWLLLSEIESIVEPSGVSYSADTWHEYFKRRYLGAKDIELPNGKVVSRSRSTADLNVSEMTDYLTKVEVFAAEHNVFQGE